MFLLIKLLIGAVMIGVTVVIHAVVCDWVLRFIQTHTPPFSKILKKILENSDPDRHCFCHRRRHYDRYLAVDVIALRP